MKDYRETEAGKWRFNHPGVYEKTVEFQEYLSKHGIAWHNPFSNECTIDFCCCEGDGDYAKYIPSFTKQLRQILDELFAECEHGDAEHRKWLKNKFDDFYNRLNYE